METDEVPYWWDRLLDGLEPPEAAYGPECREPRPRAKDIYWYALVDNGTAFAMGRRCGDQLIGMVYTQRPAPTTMVFALGLLREYRGMGLGPHLRDAALAYCFSDPEIQKVETEVYSSNTHSLGALHNRHGRMTEEGRQRATIAILGTLYDRVLFGITRPEYERSERP